MLQRWKMSHNNSMVTEPDGEWVEYKDHLAVVAEKDKEIAKRETDAEKWAKIAGQNQKQINKLADEIERLKKAGKMAEGCL